MANLNGNLLGQVENGNYGVWAYSDGIKINMSGKETIYPLSNICGLFKEPNIRYRSKNFRTINLSVKKNKKIALDEDKFPGVVELLEGLIRNEYKSIYNNTDTLKWINACTAIVALDGGWDTNLFSNYHKTGFMKFVKKGVLKRSWGVKSKSELVNVLENLKNSNGVVKFVSVLQNNEEIGGEKFASAWDLQRVVFLAGLGYLAGYLTYDEAIKHSIDACKKIQALYTGWEDFLESYLTGHMLWYGVGFDVQTDTPYYRKTAYEQEQASTYKAWDVSWDTNLV